MEHWDFDHRRSSCADLLEDLRLMLPDRSVASRLARRSKLPFKVDLLAGSLVWRIHQLADTALICYDGQMHVAGIVAARACMETAATLDVLRHSVKAYRGGDVDGIDQRLMTGILGTRNRPDRPVSFNVLGAVDKVTKRLPTFRVIYDELSEYAHPNDGGTASSFARLDPSGRTALFTALGENPRRRAWTLIESTTTNLVLAIDAYADLRRAMPEFARISDVDGSNV